MRASSAAKKALHELVDDVPPKETRAAVRALKIKLSPTAQQQLAALAEWWTINRRAARVRVEDAVEDAFESRAP